MLDLFSLDSNTRISESELYRPGSAAALILVCGLVWSSHEVVAGALRYQATRCRDWRASLELDRSLTALAGIGIEAALVGPERADYSWYMGELGRECEPQVELDALVSLLQSGAQVIAYITGTDPMLRMRSIFEKCDRGTVGILDRLIAARGSQTIEVTRPQRMGDVFVKTTELLDRPLRLVVDNTLVPT